LSNTTAVEGATVQVLPTESVTLEMLFDEPPVAELSAEMQSARVDVEAGLLAGERVKLVALVL
jgi:hypothetical protein